jgi:hypothetical protein
MKRYFINMNSFQVKSYSKFAFLIINWAVVAEKLFIYFQFYEYHSNQKPHRYEFLSSKNLQQINFQKFKLQNKPQIIPHRDLSRFFSPTHKAQQPRNVFFNFILANDIIWRNWIKFIKISLDQMSKFEFLWFSFFSFVLSQPLIGANNLCKWVCLLIVCISAVFFSTHPTDPMKFNYVLMTLWVWVEQESNE